MTILCYFSFEELLPDTDSEMDDDEDDKGKKKKGAGSEVKQKGVAAWLREDMEEDIIDFMDPGVSKKILGNIAHINSLTPGGYQGLKTPWRILTDHWIHFLRTQ